MLRTLMNSRRTAPFAAIGALTALALVTWSCGGSAGTTSYSNPITTTKTDSAIIDAATLAKWTDEGKVNAPLGTADRVVVVSVASLANFTSTTKKHIPDAVLFDYVERAHHDPRGGPRAHDPDDAERPPDGRRRPEAGHRCLDARSC